MSAIATSENVVASPRGYSKFSKLCRFSPGIEGILSQIFSDYTFSLYDEKLEPEEVFSQVGFLPVIGHIASSVIIDLYGMPIMLAVEQNLNATFGKRAIVKFASVTNSFIFLRHAVVVSKDMFGQIPCEVKLDALYEWGFSAELQVERIPVLGVIEDSVE